MSVSSVGALGGTPLTGAVKISSGNPYIGVGTSAPNNAVALTYVNTGFSSLTAQGSETLTGGAVVLASGNSNLTITADSLANEITFTATGGAGGSSISNNGATLGIDLETADLTFTSSTTVGATNNITLNADTNGGTLGSAGLILLQTSGTDNVAGLQIGGNIPTVSPKLYAVENSAGYNGGFFNLGDTTNSTSVVVSGISGIELRNAGSNDSAPLTMFNDQSNTYRSALNTTAVAGYAPTVAGASNLVVLQGGGSNTSAYADFGAGSFQILGQSATPLNPGSNATVPFITASQTNAGTASNAVVMTLNAGGYNVASNATRVNIIADDLVINNILQINTQGTVGNVENGAGTVGFTIGTNGADIYTPNTTTFFETSEGSGAVGVIRFITTDSNASQVSIGGNSNATGLWVGSSNLTFNGSNVMGGSGNMTYTPSNFTWAGSNSYAIGNIVADSNVVYVATLANSNAVPATNTGTWQPIGQTVPSSGGGITGITINGGTAYPTSGSTLNFQPGAGIVMSNAGSNIISITASPQGSGAYLTNNANTWEWLGSNTYTATEGVVSYQGGLYANILAPSSNVPPFGASNSTTLWAGLAPSLSISPTGAVVPTNIVPLAPSASNAYSYVLQPANSNVSIASPSQGVITFDVQPPVQPVITVPSGSNVPLSGGNAWTFQSSSSNITITNPSASVIDFNVDAPAINYGGKWTATGVYQIDDIVIWGGYSWVVLATTVAGESPQTAPAKFQEIGAVPTGQVDVLPANQVAGVIPQNTTEGVNMVSSWASDATYMVGNVVSDTNGGVYMSTTNGNTSNTPQTDALGSNWVYGGASPLIQNSIIQVGSNVPGTVFGPSTNFSVANPLTFITLASPISQLGSSQKAGCIASFSGSVSFSNAGLSNAGSVAGVIMTDNTGGSNTAGSFSAPYYFNTPVTIVANGLTTIPPFTVSCLTRNNAIPSTVGYSLSLIASTGTNVVFGNISDNLTTGCAGYVYNSSGSNLTLVV